jgi:hypothetical protein
MSKRNYLKIVKEALENLEIGESIDIELFVSEKWEQKYDYFVRRSFDVYLCQAKQKIKKEFQSKVFKTRKGKVIRTK